MFPGHPNLLAATTGPEDVGDSYAAKPFLSPEGANIELVKQGHTLARTDGAYEGSTRYQELYPLKGFGHAYPVLGSWIVNGEAAGMGIREDGLITGNGARFVPHGIEGVTRDGRMVKLKAATDTLKELAVIYAGILLIAALLFAWLEQQTFLDSLYWAGTTATSTGYGDISPKTLGGRMLALALMHMSIFVIAPLIVVRLIDSLNENRDAFTHEEQVQILEAINRMEERMKRLEER